MTFNPGKNPVLTILYDAPEGGNDVKTQSNFLIIVLN